MRMQTIVVIGGGFGGIYAVKQIAKHAKKDEIILISKENYFLFTPLLHEVATGSIAIRNIIEPVRDILTEKNVRFIQGTVHEVDLVKKKIKYNNNNILDYDKIIIAIGARENFFHIKDAANYCVTLKELGDAIKLKNRVISHLERAAEKKGTRAEWLRFVIIGGGPTGVELAGELADFIQIAIAQDYPELKEEKPEIMIIQKGKALIPMLSPATRKNVAREIKKKGIQVRYDCTVTKVEKEAVILNGKELVRAKTIIWTAGIKPQPIKIHPRNSCLPSGHIAVDAWLMIKGVKDAYAIGDCASITDQEGKSVPALAQAAVDQARFVAGHLYGKQEKYTFKPSGYLLSVGNFFGAGDLRQYSIHGFFAWWLWRTVYLCKLIGLTNKVRVVLDWTIQLITKKRDTVKL